MSSLRFVSVLLLLLVVATPVQAQNRSGDLFHLKFGQGLSDFSGDAGPRADITDFLDPEKFTETNNFQYALTTELGYRFSPGLSIGIGYQLGTYYFGDGANRDLHTLQVLGRYKLGASSWTVAPYADLGAHTSTGQEGFAFGPSVGGGLDLALNDRVSFFVESRLNLTFPDEAVDPGIEGIPFDALNVIPGIGAEVVLRSDPNGPQVRRVEGPTEVQVGESVTYTVTINEEDVSRPVERRWTFGDGAEDSGLTATHAFHRPGTYTVLFEAENEAGSDRQSLTVNVTSPPSPAAIASAEAAPNPVEAGTAVRFLGEAQGDPSVSYEWRFGDGTKASGRSATHTYEEAGEYTVEFITNNEAGEDSRTLRLRVESAQADPSLGPYTIQIGAFAERSNAEQTAQRVLFDGYPARVYSIVEEGRILYRIWAGSFETQQAAKRQLDQFKGYAPDAFVRPTDDRYRMRPPPDENEWPPPSGSAAWRPSAFCWSPCCAVSGFRTWRGLFSMLRPCASDGLGGEHSAC